MDSKNKIWLIVASVISAIIGAILYAVVETPIKELLYSNSPKLEVSGIHNDWSLPPISQFNEPTYISWKDFNLSDLLIATSSIDLDTNSTSTIDYDDFVGMKSIWEFRIKNVGKQKAENIKMKLPFSGFYFVEGTKKFGFFKNEITNLEDLQPTEVTYVTVWSRFNDDESYEEGTKVIYDNGSIKIKYPVEVREILPWVIMILILIYLVYFYRIWRRERNKQEREVKSKE